MMHHKSSSLILITIVLSLTFIGASCTRSGSDGGMWRSDDAGKTFVQKVSGGMQNNRPVTIGRVDVTRLTVDPTNMERVFMGTQSNGAYVSDNRGEEWRQYYSTKGTVLGIYVSVRDGQTQFVIEPAGVTRTRNGGVSWERIYTPLDSRFTILAAAHATSDPRVLYIALSNGDLMRSSDGGDTWSRMHGFEGRVAALEVNRANADIVYVASTRRGLSKSADGGRSWISFSASFEAYQGAEQGSALAIDATVFDGVVYASRYGVLRTRDGGVTWTSAPTLSAPGSFVTASIAVHPVDGETIIAGDTRAVLMTNNGGRTWRTIILDTSRIVTSIAFYPLQTSIIYLGTARAE